MNALGHHLLLECHDCDPVALAEAPALEALLRRAAAAGGAQVIAGHMHRFGAGQGVTGVLLLAESHLSIHTWPEHGYAAVDVFMCGVADAARAVAAIVDGLAPGRHDLTAVPRGVGIAQPA